MPLLEIKNLDVEFNSGSRALRAVDDLTLCVADRECVCLVGESGCGKSVTALSIARLLPSPPAHYPGGEILIEGRDVLVMSRPELQKLRGGIVSYVFQEPAASLNPVFRVGSQIKETLKLHRRELATVGEVTRLLRLVGIPDPESRARSYPHELSGGMQQRVMLALALASQPRLLVADEPTTALDVTIQAQIIDLLKDLRRQLGMAVLLITHNLGIVRDIADRIAVMYAGQIVEEGPAEELLKHPYHPYTRALLDCVPQLGQPAREFRTIPGTVPSLGAMPAGCRFHPRCPIAQRDCAINRPVIIEASPGHYVRCPYWRMS